MSQLTYWVPFLSAHGSFPHPCYFCGEPVKGYTVPFNGRAAVIHHVDEVRTNNAPDNLVPAHQACHVGFHRRGHVPTAESRQRMSMAARGRPKSAAHALAISAGMKGRKPNNFGKPRSESAKAKARLTPKPRASCTKCHREMNVTGVTQHVRACQLGLPVMRKPQPHRSPTLT